MNDNVAQDNQQVTDTDLAWLAGYLDGEGSFGIYGTRRKDGTMNYGARIQVSSVNGESMKKIYRMMKSLDLSVRLWNKPSGVPNHSDAIYTTINKLTSLYKLIPLLIPYLTIKKPHAELLFEWVKSRIDRGISRGGNQRKNLYSDEEIASIRQLKSLNTGILNEHTLSSLKEMICSELVGDNENEAETTSSVLI